MVKSIFLKKWVFTVFACVVASSVNAQEHTASNLEKGVSPLDVQTRTLDKLIEVTDKNIHDITNCAATQQLLSNGSCVDPDEVDPETSAAFKTVMPVCSGANEVAKWDGSAWSCATINLSKDCSGAANLGQCRSANLSLQDGQTQSGVTCSGDHGTCTADVQCDEGTYKFTNGPSCPSSPINCYDSVGGSGCGSMQSVNHGESASWSCDTGYTGSCSAVCKNGSFDKSSNDCSLTPVNGTCGTTADTCSTGDYDSNPADTATEFRWTCKGKNGGSDSPTCTFAKTPDCAAINKVVNSTPTGPNGLQASCFHMLPSGMNGETKSLAHNDGTCQDTIPMLFLHKDVPTCSAVYKCSGNTWVEQSSSGSCSTTPTPVTGVCGSNHDGCSKGVWQDGTDTASQYKWTCLGQNGGSDTNCTKAKAVTPVNGSCGSTANTCSAGDYDSNPIDSSTQYKWTCTGKNGGSDASCTKAKPMTPVNGSCGSTANTCSAGDYDSNPIDSSTQYKWTCTGKNGGSDASCTKAKPVNGSCGSTANTCSTGDYDSDPTDSSTEYKWTCTGKNGGTDKSCTKAKAVNGQCGSNKNTCVKGTVDNTSSTATHDLWDCKGSGGGTTDSCSKVKSSSYSWVKETTLGCSPSGFSQCSTHWEWQCQNTSGNQVSSTNCSGAAPNPSSGIDSCHCGTLGGGGGCFVPETFITMHDGTLKPVIEVKVGERVKSPQGYNTVLKKHVYDHTGKLFGVNDSENFVTGSHPIYTVEGWKAFEPVKAKQLNPELDIQQLSLGDVIVTDKGHVTLNKITHIPVQGLKVYNLRLDGSQEYYADGFVVHNK
tara:strand:+ start:18095 stop:20560 length:2466 start_codon:yes stop_codon:yes gene_type:complete